MTEVTTNTKNEQSKIKEFFSNPIIGITASILTILGFFLSIYFYFNTLASRELIYTVHPIKATALKSDEVSDLKVYYNDKEIKSDITVAQIAIWNKGKMPIKTDNILKEIKLVTSPEAPILEASIRNQSRDITGFTLDKSQYDKGIIPLSWKILEKGDGVSIQVIYAGSQEVSLKLEGIVEGQSNIKQEKVPNDVKSPSEQQKANRFDNILMIVLGGIVIVYEIISRIIAKIKHLPVSKNKQLSPTFIIIMIMFIQFIIMFFRSNQYGPPFGF